jgi:hypothetical protein
LLKRNDLFDSGKYFWLQDIEHDDIELNDTQHNNKNVTLSITVIDNTKRCYAGKLI